MPTDWDIVLIRDNIRVFENVSSLLLASNGGWADVGWAVALN
jgi:hypothetical protein